MIIRKSYKYLFFLLIFFAISCSKFEDGPYFSLLTSKQRLAREWKVEYSINLSTGISHSADFDGWILSFDKNGTYNQTIIYNQVQEDYSGQWEILGKNQLKLQYTANSENVVNFYTILRLAKNELWLKSESEEIHYYSN
jgi:hypothetical protein